MPRLTNVEAGLAEKNWPHRANGLEGLPNGMSVLFEAWWIPAISVSDMLSKWRATKVIISGQALESSWTRTTWNWNSVAPIEMSMTPLKKHHRIPKRERGESTVFRHKTAKSCLAASFWVSRAVFPFFLNFPCPTLPVEKLNIEKKHFVARSPCHTAQDPQKSSTCCWIAKRIPSKTGPGYCVFSVQDASAI